MARQQQSYFNDNKLVKSIEDFRSALGAPALSNFFKLYSKISGCTGTASTESEEFFEIYNLNVISIPTNKKMIRKDWNDMIFRTIKEKDISDFFIKEYFNYFAILNF